MTLQLLLTPEIEIQLRLRAEAEGKDIARLVVEAVEEKLAEGAADRPKPTTEQRIAAWKKWTTGRSPVGHFVDDSRDSIYEGRGE